MGEVKLRVSYIDEMWKESQQLICIIYYKTILRGITLVLDVAWSDIGKMRCNASFCLTVNEKQVLEHLYQSSFPSKYDQYGI